MDTKNKKHVKYEFDYKSFHKKDQLWFYFLPVIIFNRSESFFYECAYRIGLGWLTFAMSLKIIITESKWNEQRD